MNYLAIDIGNVICDLDFTKFNKLLYNHYWEPKNDTTSDVIEKFLYVIQSPHDLDLTSMAYELHNHFSFNEKIINEILVEWQKTIQPNKIVISYLENIIKTTNIKIALLSNMGREHADAMKNMLGETIYSQSIQFFSFAVGARKPTFLYYKTFLDMYPEFKGCLYIDDKIENLETGKLFGFDTCQFVLDKCKNKQDIEVKLLEITKLL